MAERTQPLAASCARAPKGWAGSDIAGAGLAGAVWPGAGVATFLVLLTLGAVVAVALRAGSGGALAASDWAAVRFTLGQALVSALLSVALAVPLARALARRRFFGRGLVITLLGAPFLLPTLVAVLGLLAVFGRNGLVNSWLAMLGLGPVQIYGPQGVVLAHVFFNLPLATRLILQGWLAIPSERFRLAASLGFAPGDLFRRLEWPMLREVLPGCLLVIFLICLTSFAVALTLGGGPRATTIELAIYQAFRFDFDLGRAARLAALQFLICAAAAVVALWVTTPAAIGGGLDRTVQRWDAGRLWPWDALIIAAAMLFLMLPLGTVVAAGLPQLLSLPEVVWRAAGRSVLVALASTALCLAMGLVLALAILQVRRGAGVLLDTAGMLSLAASPLVIGTGLFLIAYPLVDPSRLALPVTALVNAAMALPFALRALLPALRQAERDFGRLATSLDMTGITRLRLVLLPRIRRPLGFAGGLAAALSIGDLGVIVLFAETGSATLPMQLQRLMGAYRMADAAGAALLLLVLSLAAFWILDRSGRANAAT
ncbi:thiamine/thiamine pyrophosphate ABC transporter permease ThiP [Plastorhodobacter daqingensis]|uniref:Thiamine/thiamine pyrophosphate ABC transporter permease ThiP n=1 Tax=Plastorhodobacter daqingensis TaxID=1387281 RepID=A0ABW2UGX9_9RHOB